MESPRRVDKKKKDDEGESSSLEEPIKVYLRLRPKNKLETMKRSRDCIELHEDPKKISVESPLLGQFEFTFDQVFDEFSTQEEVFDECVSSFPEKLLQGIDSTLLVYGPYGTGKTYTLLGEGRGIEVNVLASGNPAEQSTMEYQRNNSSLSMEEKSNYYLPQTDHALDPINNPELTEGMIPRVIADLFDLLHESTASDSSIEYTIRCSYVEIYLEKMTDLLQPGREGSGLRVGCTVTDDFGQEALVLGATEICCICPEDVYAVLARGQTLRTKAVADASRDSTRSHAVFTLRLEQTDLVTGKLTCTRLQIFDLAGSETKPVDKSSDSAIKMEHRMVNASLNSFHKVVSSVLDQQQHQKQGSKPSSEKELISNSSQSSMSKIARLLQPSIGGRTHTVMICTGSPSSHSIDDTIHSLRFSQLVRKIFNTPQAAFEGYSLQGYRSQLRIAKRKEQKLKQLVRLVAQECKHGKKKSKEPKNPKVWEAVLQIVEADKKRQKKNGADGKSSKSTKRKAGEYHDRSGRNDSDDELCIAIDGKEEQQQEIQNLYTKMIELESKLQQERTAREKAQSLARDIKSELAALKSQNKSLLRDKCILKQQLAEQKAQTDAVLSQKTEAEHRLRTSQFRESEAVLFLRQLRTFYFRLLKNKAAHGSGGPREIIQEAKKRLPGVADLEDLLDVDKMMVKSGIIEGSEIGADTLVGDYHPSEEAAAKSSMEAEMAEKRELELIHQQLEGDSVVLNPALGKDQLSLTNNVSPFKNGLTYGQLAACRQKLFNTPAGLMAQQKEQELEKDLLELSNKCIGLQNSLNAEKAMVEALSGRQGAMIKMKQAQEVIMLKTELERRTNDLLAIVWKMNELHLVNKTIDTKVMTRDQHMSYLEGHITEVQTRNRQLSGFNDAAKKKLKDDNLRLQNQLDSLKLSLWQLGEIADRTPIWRVSVPCSGQYNNLAESVERRNSNGQLTEDDIESLVQAIEDDDGG